MSIHNLPANINRELAEFLLRKYLRMPTGIIYGNGLNNPPTAIEFIPDLTAQELTTLQTLSTRYNETKADYDQYSTYRDQIRSYLDVPTPTLVQTAGALKLVIRIVLFVVEILINKVL